MVQECRSLSFSFSQPERPSSSSFSSVVRCSVRLSFAHSEKHEKFTVLQPRIHSLTSSVCCCCSLCSSLVFAVIVAKVLSIQEEVGGWVVGSSAVECRGMVVRRQSERDPNSLVAKFTLQILSISSNQPCLYRLNVLQW